MRDVGGFMIELHCNSNLVHLDKQLAVALPGSDWMGGDGDYKDNFIGIDDTFEPYYVIYVTITNQEKIPARGSVLHEQVELAKELKSVFEQLGCNPEITLFFTLPDGTIPSI